MARRSRFCHIALVLLALFLLGTVIVLSTFSFYLRIDPSAYLSEDELNQDASRNLTERIPRILHQTWKTESLPEKYRNVSQHCRDIMPDYEYMLWTDASSHDFVAEHYSWFLPTFDSYRYPIQRADAIRYFVLHRFGGVYIDLDVGCNKPLDPLLVYPVVLPKTIPVGVSNDLMFAEAAHPFMDQTIHNLLTFHHSWVLNYPTVMFSTGPMFLSAQYGLYNAAHQNELRILPKALYGKNAKPEEAPNSFFTHYYGSSWHADDAGFITFLGKWGKLLMWVGLAILIVGVTRIMWLRRSRGNQSPHTPRRRGLMGRYDIILPRVSHRNGQFHLDLGSFSLSSPSSLSASAALPPSPTSSSASSSPPHSPILTGGRVPLLPVFDHDSQPSLSENGDAAVQPTSSAAQALRSAGAWVLTSLTGEHSRARPRRPEAGRSRRSTLFLLPAIFTPSSTPSVTLHERDEVEMPFLHSSRPSTTWTRDSKTRDHPSEARTLDDDMLEEDVGHRVGSSIGSSASRTSHVSGITSRTNSSKEPPPPLSFVPNTRSNTPAPPPYDLGVSRTPHSAWSSTWGEWEGEEPPPS